MDTSRIPSQATRIDLFDFSSPQMRAFHMSWFAFFIAFVGWFGVAPLMVAVREDLDLTKAQVGNAVIASVAVTVIARPVVGWVADRVGPRRAYTGLLLGGSLPVMAIGLAQDYQTFMLLRLAIGIVGASFVVTQYHTSIMFAPNVVGAANATTAGWGNVGAGVTQVVMPLLLGVLVALGLSEAVSWRLAMVFPGLAMLAMGLAYFRYTSDTPEGEFARGSRELAPGGHRGRAAVFGTLVEAARDRRVWALFVVYGACFGIELTINNIAVLYYHDRFGLSVTTAGMIAGSFGLTNVFARTLGGALSDRSGRRRGGGGRVAFLGAVLFLEGVALVVFSRMGTTLLAVPAMMTLGVFVQLANGATFAVVPFVNRRALGSVAGIVGAGGNAGAIAAGFLLRVDRLTTADALLVMGIVVASASLVTMTLRIRTPVEASTAREAW